MKALMWISSVGNAAFYAFAEQPARLHLFATVVSMATLVYVCGDRSDEVKS